VLDRLPPAREPDEPAVILGHGGWHSGHSRLGELAEVVAGLDPLVRIGAIEDPESQQVVLAGLEAERASRPDWPRRVWLAPLLAVAGAHVIRDMAGDGSDSWKSALGRAGYVCEAVLTGAIEHQSLAEVWLDHLREAVAGLDA